MFGGLLGTGIGARQALSTARAEETLRDARAQEQYELRQAIGVSIDGAREGLQRQIDNEITEDYLRGQQWNPSDIVRITRSGDLMVDPTVYVNGVKTLIESSKPVAPSSTKRINNNSSELNREDEVRRRFRNLVKMISRRANRISDFDVNAPYVPLDPIANIPVPKTYLKDQWTMDQIVAYG